MRKQDLHRLWKRHSAKYIDVIRVLGIDLALNHTGFVELDETGHMSWYKFVSNVAKHAKDDPKHGVLMPWDKKAAGDREQLNAKRLAWWQLYLTEVLHSRKPTHVGIEDYAIQAESNSAYQIGEVGGMARLAAFEVGANVRLIDPVTVKMFAAHNGTAAPETVDIAVRDDYPETQIWNGLPNLPRLDLTAAYVVARMVLIETKLRAGTMQLKDLNHEKEISVFTRCTKANPVSLLGRDWITV